MSFILLIAYQQRVNYKLLIGIVACYLIGFTAEYLGVQYGLIFGDYGYPQTLGPQLFDVPLIIGINWFLLTFTVWSVLHLLKINALVRIILATVATVMIDFLIEPVAMALNYWQWENDTIPMQNYLGWALISFSIFSIYHLLKMPFKNKLAVYLLGWQIIFFVSLNIWYT